MLLVNALFAVQEDGTVVVPEVLRPYMMGIEVIKPKKKIITAA